MIGSRQRIKLGKTKGEQRSRRNRKRIFDNKRSPELQEVEQTKDASLLLQSFNVSSVVDTKMSVLRRKCRNLIMDEDDERRQPEFTGFDAEESAILGKGDDKENYEESYY